MSATDSVLVNPTFQQTLMFRPDPRLSVDLAFLSSMSSFRKTLCIRLRSNQRLLYKIRAYARQNTPHLVSFQLPHKSYLHTSAEEMGTVFLNR